MDRNDVRNPAATLPSIVALRKESVDRNTSRLSISYMIPTSLSARRAWIEMFSVREVFANFEGRSPQGERG